MANSNSLREIYLTNQTNPEIEIDFSLQDNFNDFIRESTIYLLSLQGDEIAYQKAEDAVDATECERYQEHLRHHLRRQIFGSPEKIVEKGFSDIIQHFKINQPKKKLFCCCGDYYLVKKYFTEGVQYVNPGELHTYKAIEKPLYIYETNNPLVLNTFKIEYDSIKSERISPGETKHIPSDTYYLVIAWCHTLFKKVIINTHRIENSTEITPLFTLEDLLNDSIIEERNEWSSSEETGQSEELHSLGTSNSLPHLSGPRDDEYGISREFETFVRLGEPEKVDDTACSGAKTSPTKSDRQAKRADPHTSTSRPSTSQMETAVVPFLPISFRVQTKPMSNLPSGNDDHGRVVFAIRKDSNIESYALRPNSTFRVLQDNTVTGSFAIENEDMDPQVIEYHSDKNFIREVSKFKNGSTFENVLTVQKGLINELLDSARKKEKVVVDYFFEVTFRNIEAAYEKFAEMRKLKMIGSSVPAIVPLTNAIFFGPVSDAYEAKL